RARGLLALQWAREPRELGPVGGALRGARRARVLARVGAGPRARAREARPGLQRVAAPSGGAPPLPPGEDAARGAEPRHRGPDAAASAPARAMSGCRSRLLAAGLGLVWLAAGRPACAQEPPPSDKPGTTWLEGKLASWNTVGAPVPRAPRPDGDP